MHRSLVFLGFALTTAAVAYEIVAAARLRAVKMRPQNVAFSATPRVTILKPLAGIEAQLYENLCSFVDQRYPALQVIFGVASARDPAIDVVEQVIARFPNADISLVVGDGSAAANPKIANLSTMMAQAKHELLVIADADMRVDGGYVEAVVSAFDDPGVGAVTSLYCAVPDAGVASMLGAMYINEQFTPSVLVASLVEPLAYCFGSTMAVRRAVLDEIGGLAALGSHIGDDYLLGKLVSEQGYRVALAPYVVENIVHEDGLRALAQHELRWARTVRVQRPLGYASLFITQPMLCALLLLVTANGSQPAWIAFAVAFASRALVWNAARHAFPRAKPPAWLLPLRDLLTAGVWMGGFFAGAVRWRDRSYSLGRDGSVATSRQ